jgi:hypothetical protein
LSDQFRRIWVVSSFTFIIIIIIIIIIIGGVSVPKTAAEGAPNVMT